ncbi:helix-turn-helix domain-containing protein [uncultured Roseobacter sp.]|uniref:helix-turn-helix domain-containing protein n=1 Tax=uncultured Roseobacter sp. TaxID=114847 RepID=UPI00345793D7
MLERDPIKFVARRCAMRGLNLKDARDLFDALMISDAIALEDGNKTKAAKRLGIKPAQLHRIKSRHRSIGNKDRE